MTVAKLTFSKVVSGLVSASGSRAITDVAAEIANPASVLAAQPGVLTTRVSNTAGTLTMTSVSHGIVTGQRFDLYWTGGSCYGVTAGTVSGASIPFTVVIGGDNLPTALTDIKAGIATNVPFDLIGDDISALLCSAGVSRAYFIFEDVADAVVAALLLASGEIYAWDGDNANPLAGDTPTDVWMSHDSLTPNTTMQAVALRH